MITLDIKFIEKRLKKQIARNVISVGFDVAEAFTGVCILTTDKDKITIEHTQVIETTSKDDHFHRADNYVASLEKFKNLMEKYQNRKLLVIERCFFGQNAETLIHLAHFGIITYILLKKIFDTYYYFGASTARSIIGFNQKRQEEKGTLKAEVYSRDTKDKNGKIKHRKGEAKKIDCKSLVHNYLKTDFNVEFESKDVADAFVLALAGLLK
jgi:Holliday junction resolvasome RuvABC endonuclease subunit